MSWTSWTTLSVAYLTANNNSETATAKNLARNSPHCVIIRRMKNAASSPDLLSAVAKLPGAREADWRVIRGDCLSVLPKLPDKSANMIFADPPYNLQLKGELWRTNMTRFNGVTAKWDKFTSFAEYDAFCESWLSECRRILTDDGTLWVIGTYHNIGRVSRLMQDLKFWLLNDVIWRRTTRPRISAASASPMPPKR